MGWLPAAHLSINWPASPRASTISSWRPVGKASSSAFRSLSHEALDRVQGIVYMEAIVTPLTWADWPENARRVFQGFRSESGEEMILEKNMFVERVLPNSVIRKLSEAEMAAYRKPFVRPGEDRRPTLTWPRMIPIEGNPADVVKVVENYGAWLASADVPKLFINADPRFDSGRQAAG